MFIVRTPTPFLWQCEVSGGDIASLPHMRALYCCPMKYQRTVIIYNKSVP